MTGITIRTSSRGVKSYRAETWDNDRAKTISKTFPTAAAAKSWRAAMQTKIRMGTAGAVEAITLRAYAEDWLAKAQAGSRKPSVLRGYEASLANHVLPVLGTRKLADIRLDMVQELIDTLVAEGKAPSTVRNHISPLRVIFREAHRRKRVHVNPMVGIELPSGEDARDRIATPAEAAGLLEALQRDRTLWATAFYTGLRCGELMALDWSSVDLIGQRITVARSYDPKARVFIAPKSRAGQRTVPFPDLLLPFLTAENRTSGLVFGTDGLTPFGYTGVRKRALRAWANVEPITLHECRHTYASLMLAAGVDMTKVSKWMGHSSITITVDRYGHLVPGDERQDMARFQTYLTR